MKRFLLANTCGQKYMPEDYDTLEEVQAALASKGHDDSYVLYERAGQYDVRRVFTAEHGWTPP